jgi:hypothetical protein
LNGIHVAPLPYHAIYEHLFICYSYLYYIPYPLTVSMHVEYDLVPILQIKKPPEGGLELRMWLFVTDMFMRLQKNLLYMGVIQRVIDSLAFFAAFNDPQVPQITKLVGYR